MTSLPKTEISCEQCEACCCRLEVMIISETGVPNHYVETDQWGGEIMHRLDDGWCAALSRSTMKCTIYESRPWICRELQAGEEQCISVRESYL